MDVLVNNVGVVELRPFAGVGDAEWQRHVEVNLMSGVRLSRGLLPGMLARGWGRVVFVGTESAVDVPADMVPYAATKAASLALANGLVKLTRGTAVTVNSVLGTPTSLLQRLIEPAEIASLLAYLAGPLSPATNGAALRADGGVLTTLV